MPKLRFHQLPPPVNNAEADLRDAAHAAGLRVEVSARAYRAGLPSIRLQDADRTLAEFTSFEAALAWLHRAE